jgi:flagellar operon protein
MNEILPKPINQTRPVRQSQGVGAPGGVRRRDLQMAAGRGFADLVAAQLDAQRAVRLSAHARSRLEARALDFDPAAAQSLRAAVDLAEAKGARQSLVLLDSLALIVNIPSRTVITAMESDGARGTVFTNIDSAIVAQGGDATDVTDGAGPPQRKLPPLND